MSLTANNTTYRNEASAYIGDTEVSNTAANEFRAIDVSVPTCSTATCGVTQSGVVAYSAPTATTTAASNVTSSSATISGSYTTGGDPNTNITLRWGASNNLSVYTDVSMGTASSNGDTSTALSGLTPGTTYYFRIIASNSIGTANGEILSFQTGAPTATTSSADQVTTTTARLRGSYTTGGGLSTDVVFIWSANPALTGGTTIVVGTNTNNSDTSTALSGLTPGTTYYYQISATASSITANGAIVSFTTNSDPAQNSTPAPTPAPPPPPPPPVITSLSATLLCAASNDLIIYGSAFEGASVTFDGAAVPIKQSSASSLVVTLPSAPLGTKSLVVTTPNGRATATVTYLTASKPKFQPIRIPYLSQGTAINLDIAADDARSFKLTGRLPSGVTFNEVTGLISGTPTENGVYVLSIVAVGVCGEVNSTLELDIDAPTPNAMSHRINFLPGSCELTDSAKASFEEFITKIKGLSPRNIIPDIYISGGSKNSDPNSPTAKCRQESLCDLLLIEDLTGDILTDVFTGSENRIEVIVYWPRPNDDQ